MPTTILFIHRQLSFAVSVKQALERSGGYEVHPFTGLDSAIDYLSSHPQDLAIVDFDMPAASGDEIVVLLRETQNEIPIIATPIVQPPVLAALQLQGTVEGRFTARDIIPTIEQIMVGRRTGTGPLNPDRDPTRTGLLNRVIDQPKTDRLPKTREQAVDVEIPQRRPKLQPILSPFEEPEGAEPPGDEPPGEAPPVPLVMPELPRAPAAEAQDAATFDQDIELDVDFGEDTPASDPFGELPFPELEQAAEQALDNAPEPAPTVDPSQLFADFGGWQDPGGYEEQIDSEPVDSEPFEEFAGQAPYEELDRGFDDILNALEDAGEADARPRSKFDNLVESMRTDEAVQPLPARQQFIEFTLTSGMDSLLEQIERKRAPASEDLGPGLDTGKLPDLYGEDELPPKLPPEPEYEPEPELPPEPLMSYEAAVSVLEEEPESASFEDTGTVGDLITGVNDSSFQNVLSILRGEAVPDEVIEHEEQPPLKIADDTEDFLAAIESDLGLQPANVAERIEYDFGSYEFTEDDSGSTPAKIILASAAAPSASDDLFSIEDLLTSIEEQLPDHKPNIRPLPSWQEPEKPRQPSLRDRVASQKPLPPPATVPEMPPPQPEPFSFEDAAAATQPDAVEVDFDSLEFAGADEGGDFYDQTTTANTGVQPPEALALEETEFYGAPDFGEFAPSDEAVAFEDDYAEAAHQAADETALDEGPLVYEQPDRLPEFTTGWEPAIEAGPAAAADEQAVQPLAYEDDMPERRPGYDTEFERMATFAFAPPAPAEAAPFESTHVDDPYIAQLALSLTDVSLELTADATLLSRSGNIVAYAGRMPRDEMQELRETLGDDWDAKQDEARIRFINLPASGKDYLVYSRRTVDELTLTLIFSGETPLRDIRQQGKRLIDALRTVPEASAATPAQPGVAGTAAAASVLAAAPAASTPVEDLIARQPFTYVWILRDSNAHLPRPTAQAIVRGMQVQLAEQAWRVHDLRADEDYVYVMADVPGETPPNVLIRELKQRAAQIAHAQNRTLNPDQLWAESYLVVTPGRPLEIDEIQQFIDFERML